MKKSIIITVGSIVVVAALVLAIIFVFSGKGETPSPQNEKLELKGTWLVVANYTKDIPVFTENQYMIFTDTEASMYKDATSDAFAKSSYTINETNQLVLSDISREYKIAQKTKNCVRLYENTDTYMLLVRNSTDERDIEAVTQDLLTGKWNVTLKADTLNNGEVMEFEGTTLKYFKSGNEAPVATADYTVENNMLSVDSLSMNMRCFKINDNTIFLVEESGIVWELVK